MTVFSLPRTLPLALAGLALAATACADVGSGSKAQDEFPVVKSTDQDVVVCQSIRTAIQRDLKAAKTAEAAGDKAAAARAKQSVQAGVEGSKSVKGCDVTDLVPVTGASPSPS